MAAEFDTINVISSDINLPEEDQPPGPSESSAEATTQAMAMTYNS